MCIRINFTIARGFRNPYNIFIADSERKKNFTVTKDGWVTVYPSLYEQKGKGTLRGILKRSIPAKKGHEGCCAHCLLFRQCLQYNLNQQKYREWLMTKADLIEKMAAASGCTKACAGKALDGALEAITKAVMKGDKVALVGFGTFSLAKRKARTGRNPQTGATIKIAAKKLPKFSAGKAFKDAVNK